MLAALALTGLSLFLWQELRDQRPAVNLRLLRNVPFASATALGGVLGMALIGSLFLLPLFFENVLGYTATLAGEALMPRPLAMALAMPIGGLLYNRLGPRVLVGGGLIVGAWSFWTLSHLTLQVGYWDLFWPQIWQGVGFGLIFVALSTAALAAIPRPEMTDATGLYNVVRQVCRSIGIAVAATISTASVTRYSQILGSHLTATDGPSAAWLRSVTGAMRAAGTDPEVARLRALQLLSRSVDTQAGVLANNHVFALIAVLFVVISPLILLLKGAEAGPA